MAQNTSPVGLVPRVLTSARGTVTTTVVSCTGVAAFCGAVLLSVLCLLPSVLLAATPPNTMITNTANADYTVGNTPVTVPGSATVTTAGQTPATIEFMRVVPSGAVGATNLPVLPTTCQGNILAAPVLTSGASLPLSSQQPLASAERYAKGDPVFIKVTDFDRNQNPLLAETITITVSTVVGTVNNDSETLTLTETGPSTGIFLGYVPSTAGPSASGNCVLNTSSKASLRATYFDTTGAGSNVIADSALIDPFGVAFDSATGLPVNGVSVTFINVATGLPGAVFGNDGVSAFPSTVITGSTVTDAGGEVYAFAPGRYQFPLATAGTYRLQIVPPAGYAFPSTVPNATLGTLAGGPFAVVVGSRGENFALVDGPPLNIDIPLDPARGALQLTKSAGKAAVAIGEYVPYSLSIRNPNLAVIAAVRIADRLPAGFRYQAGSARLDGAALPNPTLAADGRSLTFSVGTIAAGATVTLKYVAAVVAGAKPGPAENTARAVGVASNTARASVLVREDLPRSRAILMGRVIVGSCDDQVDNDATGLAQVRIVLQDGTYILTDKDGRWHADNIRPGTHVVQLDLDSLPTGYEVVACENNSRFAGRSYSQFVNVQGGSLWRADFYVKKIATGPDAAGNGATPSLADQDQSDSERAFADMFGSGAPAAARETPVDTQAGETPVEPQLVEKLSYDETWLAAAAPGIEWLHPQESFQPALPVVKIAVKHDAAQRVEIKINGEAVNPMRYEGMIKNTAGTLALSNWRAVDIKEGANLLELTVFDAQGNMVKQERRTLHYGGAPVKVVLDETRSRLVADGKTRPVIAVRLLDKDGKPARRGLRGEFMLNAPYQAQDTLDGIERRPLSGNLGGKPRFTVVEDGVAFIELEPTTHSGEAVVSFEFHRPHDSQKDRQEVRAWLTPGDRKWILVGFAEGTAGHKSLRGNMESLTAAQADDKLFDRNRIAFYAKGTIKGEYLLTAAYDTAKEQGSGGARNLKQAIDPTQYYTLYADATQPRFDAASADKLYLKIEKRQFYAMFGDYDTGLTVTELGRYSRSLNGVKSEFKGDQLSYNAFAARTAQSYKRDEIQGDGTSGLYRLSSRDIVINSDKVTVEVRDRFQSQVIISKRNYTRYLEYDIDHAAGTLFFREPIPPRDPGFNPVFIVAEYEAEDRADEKMSYGGRVAYKIGEQSDVGLTHIREGSIGQSANLTAADATLHVTDTTKLRAEVATSDRDVNGAAASGKAWLLEARHEDETLSVKGYLRETESGFGVRQQAAAETGMRKAGADARLKLTDHLRVQGGATRQKNIATNAHRDTLEAQTQWHKENLTASAGWRSARDTDSRGVGRKSNQALAGVAYTLLDKTLTVSANSEVDLGGGRAGSAGSADFPNRYGMGADYKITQSTSVFARHELARGRVSADTTRVGLRAQPWDGGEMATSLGNQAQQDSGRLFANMGLTQKWQVNERWQADVGVDHSRTLRTTALNPLNTNQALASGTPIAAAPGIVTGDYFAIHAGAGYHDKIWSGNGRIERRSSDQEKKLNVLIGAQRHLDEGRSVAAGVSASHTSGIAGSGMKLEARVSYAHRPNDSRWVWLDRLDYAQESITSAAASFRARKLVNNFNANYMPNRRTQMSLQYGSKYVMDRIEGRDYAGYTDLIGLEARRDLGPCWDIGLHAGMLRSWSAADTREYHLGASIGYRVMDNAWLSVGYNHLGFRDGDFSGADYRAQGAYVTIRVKIDQDTLGLNE